MRISDWSSDVCSSDLVIARAREARRAEIRKRLIDHASVGQHDYVPASGPAQLRERDILERERSESVGGHEGGMKTAFTEGIEIFHAAASSALPMSVTPPLSMRLISRRKRSEEQTSELQSLMRISYAV